MLGWQTAIFDCCHSSSGTRGGVGEPGKDSINIRGVLLHDEFGLDLDVEKGHGARTATRFGVQ